MIPRLVLFTFIAFAAWVLRRDARLRTGISTALWIPTLWVIILSSRPLSTWLGTGGGTDSLEGSPLDRSFYFILIAVAFYVIHQRRVDWAAILWRNWAIFLFYFFLLISVSWAEYPFVSFKRWFKEFGNSIVLLVILTEADPAQAFRTVYFRCAAILLPLSFIFVRWFPEIGRRYGIHSGAMEAVGVTNQKNDLGALVFAGCLVVLWDLLERSKQKDWLKQRLANCLSMGLLLLGAYLINLCDAKTSMVCFALAAAMLFAARLPLFANREAALAAVTIVAVLSATLLDSLFGIREVAVHELGRDMTFTGRTDVWRELLNLHTDPIIGTGFCSFWSDKHYLSQLPQWVAHSAHNGYLEIYIDGGWLGILFLGIMLVGVALSLIRRLLAGANYALVSFAIFLAVLMDNFSESYFARMSPVGFLFLLGSIDYVHVQQNQLATEPAGAPESADFPIPLDGSPEPSLES